MNEPDASVAVVTGAAQGIGRAIATTLAGAGWTVVAVDVTGLDDLPAMGALLPLTQDVTAPDAGAAALALAREHGTLRGWVNNAALVELVPFTVIEADHVARMLAVDLQAYLTGCQVAIREFVATGTPGAIVNITSVHARLGFAQHALYDSCKAAVEGLTRSVAAEYHATGIRVNALAPGAVMTEREVAARRDHPPVHEPIPLSLFSTPAEIATVVAFLLDPASSAINGATIAADRGLSTTFIGPQPG